MDYVLDLSAPADTAQNAPVSTELRLPRGEISQVRVFLPPGCAGLVGARFLIEQKQVYPSNPRGWYTGDGTSLVINDLLNLPEDYQTLRCEVYNDDDTFSHRVTFGVTVMTEVLAGRPAGIPGWLWRLLRR